MIPDTLNRISGLTVVVHPDFPKFQLSEDVPVTDAFRAQFNVWAREFFGMTNLLEDGQASVTGSKVFMNPRTYAFFKAATHPGRYLP